MFYLEFEKYIVHPRGDNREVAGHLSTELRTRSARGISLLRLFPSVSNAHENEPQPPAVIYWDNKLYKQGRSVSI